MLIYLLTRTEYGVLAAVDRQYGGRSALWRDGKAVVHTPYSVSEYLTD